MLISVQVIGIVPKSIAILRVQAIGIHSRVYGPWVNFFERIIFVDEKNAISVFLEKPREKRRVHARTEGAFEIVVIDDRHFGIFFPASGRPPETTFFLNAL